MYDDGPDSGVPGCSDSQPSGCWVDRHIALDRFGSHDLVMGAGFDPTGDTSSGDQGGSSLAAILTVGGPRRGGGDTHRPDAYTWNEALAATSAGTLRPLRSVPSSESATGIPDPRHNVAPVPDYTRVCSPGGLDDSPACIAAVLAAVNHAHTLEGVRPMVLPSGFARLSVPDQLFVAVNLERVDRGLPPLGGLTTALDRERAGGSGRRQRPARPRGGVRARRRGVGRRVRQRPRRGLRVDVRGRLRQRQPGLPASRRGGLLGPPQGHPRRRGIGAQPGDGCRAGPEGRHSRRGRGWDLHGGHPGRGDRTAPVLHLQLGAGAGGAARGAP